jgi:hypothetical protein
MNEIKIAENQQATKKKDFLNPFINLIREILAILLWTYLITKVFVFDIDIFLVEIFFPNYMWIINYKFFILIGILATVWLVTKNKDILLWSLYIFFYPLIIFLWKIPSLLLKKRNWNLIFATIDAVISFFKSFKVSFITTSFFLASTVIISTSSNKILLWFSIVILAVILLVVYIQRLVLVFKQSGIYQIYSKVFSSVGNILRKPPPPDDLITSLSIENMGEEQIQNWGASIQLLVLFNRICLFVAQKMKSYQDSGFNIVSSVLGILMLVLYTVLTFAIINYGLFKIDQFFFTIPKQPSFFNFFYYSFNVLLFNQIQEVVPATPAAQVAFMAESFYALFLIAILISLVFSVSRQINTDELNSMIKDLQSEGIRIEGFLKEIYKFSTVEEAMELLRKLKVGFVDLAYKITESLVQ